MLSLRRLVVACVSLALVQIALPAAADGILPASVGNSLYISTASPASVAGGFGQLSLSGSDGSSAISTITPGVPSISVSASGIAGVTIGGNTHLDYYLQVTGPDPSVLVGVQAFGQVQTSPTYGAAATVALGINEVNGPGLIFDQITCQAQYNAACSQAFSINNSYLLVTNAYYAVDMSTSIGINSEPYYNGSISAYVDPYFTAPLGYSIVLSDGIGNSPIAATPLPAALPLFGAGLGAIGLLGWRRKRKNVAAIAAA